MVEGGSKCVKLLLVVFNFIFCVAGLALIIVGALGLTKFKDHGDAVFGGQLTKAATLVIVLGVIIFLVAALGFFGACTENSRMLFAFAIALIVIFILEVVGIILAFTEKGAVKDEVTKFMNGTKADYNDGKGVKAAWDWMQDEFECCGWTKYSSWVGIDVGTNKTVPKSCCKESESSCTGAAADVPSKINIDGCYDKVVDWAESNLVIIGAVSIVCAIIQLVGIVFACMLARDIKKTEHQQI